MPQFQLPHHYQIINQNVNIYFIRTPARMYNIIVSPYLIAFHPEGFIGKIVFYRVKSVISL